MVEYAGLLVLQVCKQWRGYTAASAGKKHFCTPANKNYKSLWSEK